MKEGVKEFFRIFGGAVVGVVGLIASVCFVVAMAPYAWLLFGIFGGIGSALLIVFNIYNGCAELHFIHRKAGPSSSVNYRRVLRKLKRQRATAVRKMYSMKAYSDNASYYLDIIAVEKKIAEHMGIDYVKPDYLPKDRWS
jgi:hypothetical protein